jgi:hypothetical protein
VEYGVRLLESRIRLCDFYRVGYPSSLTCNSRSNEAMDNTRVFRMTFAPVYPHYITKVEKKGRTS